MFNKIIRRIIQNLTGNVEDTNLIMINASRLNFTLSILFIILWLFSSIYTTLLYLSLNVIFLQTPINAWYNVPIGIGFITMYTLTMFLVFRVLKIEFLNSLKGSKFIGKRLFLKLFVLKGKALSKSDIQKIQKENPVLYRAITKLLYHGYCYSTCFELLQCLKKGEMHYIAVHQLQCAEEHPTKYTMHVLYVYNDWCFDTYSQTQVPYSKAVEAFNPIPYKVFKYEDIKGKDYYEFKAENQVALHKWCDEIDCFCQFSESN